MRLARALPVVSLLAVSLLVPLTLQGGAAGADPVGDRRAQADRLAAQLDSLNRRSSQLAEAYDQARLRQGDVNAKLDAARAALGLTDGQLSGARSRVRDMAVDSYMHGGPARQISLLVPSSANEIADRGTYVRSVTANTSDAVDALHQAHVELGRLQAQLAGAQADAAKAVGQVQASQAAAADADAATAAAYDRAQSQLGTAVLQQVEAQRAAAEQARVQAAIASGHDPLPVASRGGRPIARVAGAGRGLAPRIVGGGPVSGSGGIGRSGRGIAAPGGGGRGVAPAGGGGSDVGGSRNGGGGSSGGGSSGGGSSGGGSSGGGSSGGGSSGGGSSGGGAVAPPAPPPPADGAQAAIAEARRQLGKPYVYGGSGPDSFDCSGLTAWAWGHAGHSLPHSAADQYYETTHVSVSQLQPGDLVFWGSPPHHVGIYVGGGEMIDGLHSGTNVEYDSIYLESDLIGGGRVN